MILIACGVLIFSVASCASSYSPLSSSANSPVSRSASSTLPIASSALPAPAASSQAQEPSNLTLGSTFTFDGFQLTFGTKIGWDKISNQFSEQNGKDAFYIPVTVTNNTGKTSSLNMFYYKVFSPSGLQLETISAYFKNTLEFLGDMRNGAKAEARLYVLYDGNGDYYVSFDNWTEKLEVKVPIAK
jgi:hypothetical protein